MQNTDRALAYAKQRGVEIPDIDGLMKLKKEDLMREVLHHAEPDHRAGKALTKMTKGELVDQILIARLLPQLTPAQRRRIRHCNDHTATLAARKERKMAERVARLRRRAGF